MKTRKSKYLILCILILITVSARGALREVPSRPASSCPLAEFRFVDEQFGKPPLIKLYFEVTLCNKYPMPGWFLLPANLGPDRKSQQTNGGVDAVEVFMPHGQGRVIIGRFLGNGGFQALLLRPGAVVHFRRFQVSYWGEMPHQLEAEVIVAKRLKIGRKDARRWFGIDPLSSRKVEITESATDTMRIVRSRRTPDNREVPVEIGESESVKIQIDLKK
jgi:hypothetical protein